MNGKRTSCWHHLGRTPGIYSPPTKPDHSATAGWIGLAGDDRLLWSVTPSADFEQISPWGGSTRLDKPPRNRLHTHTVCCWQTAVSGEPIWSAFTLTERDRVLHSDPSTLQQIRGLLRAADQDCYRALFQLTFRRLRLLQSLQNSEKFTILQAQAPFHRTECCF